MESLSKYYNELWEKRDTRLDGWPFLDSPLPTLFICITYVFLVTKAGPLYMKNRAPYDLKATLILYNALQVCLSFYIFVELLCAGWWFDYSYTCQPVDYSMSPKALRMMHAAYWYFISKFTELFDTFCFVGRKKFSHISLLHVVHHGIMPISVWLGARFVPGGHATFFGLCNTFVHIFMYLYYLIAALGPRYAKYCWWKQHMTTLQIVQFICILIHGFQLPFYKECDFPWQFSIFIAAHAILFLFLFSQFYVKTYLKKSNVKTSRKNE